MASVNISEFRNASALNADGTRMDVEINHPEYGWIPYTIEPSDTDMTIDNNRPHVACSSRDEQVLRCVIQISRGV